MFKLTAKLRECFGKRPCRRLRRLEGLLPASIYLKKEKCSLPITLNHNDVLFSQEKEGFLTQPLEICLEGAETKSYQVIFKEIQRHPFKNALLHVDLAEV